MLEYTPYQTLERERWQSYLNSHSEELRRKFSAIVARYNFENIPNLPEEEQEIQQIEFFHGSGDLLFRFMLNLEDDEFDPLFDEENLFPEDTIENPMRTFEYLDEWEVYREEERDSKLWGEKKEMLFAWLAQHWQDCGGHRCGIMSNTLENNSVRCFNLMAFTWDDFLETPSHEAVIGERAEYPYNRDLTFFEIQQNCISGHPWRYMVNGDAFAEIGVYQNHIGWRSGKISDYATIPFELEKTNMTAWNLSCFMGQKCHEFFKNHVNEGYYEQPRPANAALLFEAARPWHFGSYGTDFQSISEGDLDALEEVINRSLPTDYRHFLFFYNGSQPNDEANFKTELGTWRRLATLFNLEELLDKYAEFKGKRGVEPYHLPIGGNNDGDVICLGLEKTNGGVFIYREAMGQMVRLKDNFFDFIEDLAYFSQYFHPKSYHIEQRNIFMVRKWIAEGWDVNENIGYNRPAIVGLYNEEIRQLLLENGALEQY